MNAKMVHAAQVGLTFKGFIKEPHCCQMWVRQVYESVYDERFDDFQKDTAILAGRAWKRSRYAVLLRNGSVPGDLLYKLHGSGGDGHVGIRLPGNIVAENSSVHWDGKDARGTRTLKEFGNFDLIVRLPNL